MEQLFEQYRTFRLSQQRLHDEERKIWERERGELQKRIQELEETVAALLSRHSSSGNVTSPTAPAWASSSFGSYPPIPPPQPARSTGKEVWRGPASHPTRTFSDVTETTTKPLGGVLASIPEHLERRKSVGFTGTENEPNPRGSSMPAAIPGEYISPDYDGISLKPKLLPPEIIKIIASPESASPMHDSPSPRTVSSPTKPASEPRPKMIDIAGTRLGSEALYTQDAGHTPLVQVTGADSAKSSIPSPSAQVQEIEAERPPLEPAPTRRLPNERSDSYFPSAQDDQRETVPEAPAEDPALTGPLSLSSSHNKPEDVSFLEKVNSQLDLQAKQVTAEGQSDAGQQQDPQRESANSDHGDDEGGPRLRIKRSMNFGAPFGSTGA
ncbi:MAG: hypothetical protein LQ340_005910 [Diploschistes diacapsis]|nr:MAG: hypothetical protein LQ340_005910 [Diploschistes diacapsis]